jgi:hypothetical protein
MRRWGLSGLAILMFGLMVCLAGAFAQSAPKVSLPVAVANDNRAPSGVVKNNILELQLEMREAVWYPEEEGGGNPVARTRYCEARELSRGEVGGGDLDGGAVGEEFLGVAADGAGGVLVP